MEISDKDIEKLGDLARIKLSPEEKKELSKDIESILGYVSEIQEISSDMSIDNNTLLPQSVTVCNVMREDEDPHESGLYTERILKESPEVEDNYIKVKKIL